MEFKPITSVFLHVTNACNCRCRYCFETARPDFMSLDTAMDVAKYLIRNAEEVGAIPGINFFGGEPMLRWDDIIVPLVDWIRGEYGKPFQLSMTSNCTLMTEERLKYMKENQISLLFSIDGARETQDYNRPLSTGKGSYGTLEGIIDLVPRYFPNTTFRSTVIPPTCHHVFENIMFAKEHGYNNFFVVPNVMEEWSNERWNVLAKEMRKYSDYCVGEWWAGRQPIRFSEMDKAMGKIQRINTAILHDERRPEEKCGACAKCGLATNRFAAVDYKGDLYGCQELVSAGKAGDFFYIGNIYSGIDVGRRERLATAYKACAEHGPNCSECRLDRICDGGCVANNYFVTGDVNTVAPVYCRWVNLLLDEAIYICNEMGNEPPEAFVAYWRRVNDGGRH